LYSFRAFLGSVLLAGSSTGFNAVASMGCTAQAAPGRLQAPLPNQLPHTKNVWSPAQQLDMKGRCHHNIHAGMQAHWLQRGCAWSCRPNPVSALLKGELWQLPLLYYSTSGTVGVPLLY
jgi:hypothetical protein